MAKIAQVTPALAPGRGIEGVSYHLARHLTSRQHEVTTLTCDFKPFAEDGKNLGKVVIPRLLRLIQTRLQGYLRMFLRTLILSVWSTLRLRHLPAETIRVSHGDTFGGDVYVAHSCHWAAVHTKIRAGEWKWVFNPFQWLALVKEAWNLRFASFTRMIAVSSGVGRECVRYHGFPQEKVQVIPNGVDIQLFHNKKKPENRRRILEECSIQGDPVTGVFVAHEFSRKGLVFVLEAMARPGIHQDRFHLLVIGGDRVPHYQKKAEELGIGSRVSFLGLRDAREVAFYMSGCDVFVFPTNYEAFPLVVLEALASGTPVLAPAVNGIEDCLEEGRNGFLIERDSASIAEKLDYIVRERHLLAELSVGARQTAEAYDWSDIIGRYATLFEGLARANKSV